MSLRIGRTIIDTRDWSVEDYDVIIRDLRKERARKGKADELKLRMETLLNEAKENNFDFIDKDFGNVIRPVDVELIDNE